MPFKLAICSFITLFTAFSVQAEVHLERSRLWDRARLIAPGQRVFSVQTSYQETAERFSSDGTIAPLGQNYARKLTWDQLLQSESAQGRADLRAYMRRRGVHESDVAATAGYTVTRQEVGFEINWAYGLARNWMIGLRLPLTHRTTRVRESVEMTPALLNGLQATSGADLGGHVKQLAEAQLANSGYDRVPDEKQSWDWGDISLVSQESLLQARRWQVSLQELVRFPTAQSPSIADYIQTSNDEGQVDIGATLLADYQASRWLVGTRFGYVMQLPDTTRMRTSLNSAQSDSANPSVRRDLGDWVWGAIDGEVKIARHWDFDLEHAFLSKARDSYSGDSLSGTEYARLADDSDQQVQQSRIGLQYRIGGSGIRDGISNRWSASLDYTRPWIGRNATDASRTSLELTNYF